jgi:hypothetical protein
LADQSDNSGSNIIEQLKGAADTIASDAFPKVMLGLIPSAGPAVLEIVNAWQKKIEEKRLHKLLNVIHARLDGVDEEILSLKAENETFTEMLESAVRAAAETQSDDKIGYIGNLVANAILYQHITVDERQYLLDILRQLHPAEVIVLASYSNTYQRDESFREQHAEALDVPSLHLGGGLQDAHSAAVRQGFRHRLLQLGLLETKQGAGGKARQDISQLGRALLREVGLLGPNDM